MKQMIHNITSKNKLILICKKKYFGSFQTRRYAYSIKHKQILKIFTTNIQRRVLNRS